MAQQVFGRRSVVLIMHGTTPKRMKKYVPYAGKAAWGICSGHWINVFREKHFDQRYAEEYGYRKRDGEDKTGREFWKSYTGRKRKKYGHSRPLKYTGRGYAATLASRGRLWRGGKGVSIIIPARIYNFKPKGWPYPMRQELTVVSRPESQWIERTYEEKFRKYLKEAKEKVVLASN